jgi:hypothetical protein
MNGGVGDAVNLGWKIAATLQAWGGAGLLDSYEHERRQFHIRALEETEKNYDANDLLRPGLEDPTEGTSRREALAAQIQRTKPQNFKSLGITLGYRYEGSPVVVSDGTPATAFETSVYIPTARPGHRAPHYRLPDGTALFDRFGVGFTLLVFGEPDTADLEQAARTRGVPLTVLRLPGSDVRELYACEVALIRPDQHVAWRGNAPPWEPDRVWDRVLGRESGTTATEVHPMYEQI